MRKLIYTLLLSVASIQLQASQAAEDHVPVESRPFTHAEKLVVAEERAKEPKPSNFDVKCNMSVGSANLSSNYHSVHPGAYRRPVNMTPFGETVMFDDGSWWDTYPGQRYISVTWNSLDTIVVIQNTDAFSSYLFKLVNITTDQKVEVNMSRGPLYESPMTYWIKAINPVDRKVVLSDNSIWDLSRWDYQVYSRWFINDTIMIGVNDGTLTSFNPNILINVNTLTFSRASLDN